MFAYGQTVTASYDADLAPAAALIGDPTRAAFLSALMSGTALAAGELARTAGVSAATASAHLARLLDGGLVRVERQGRHRYYRLADDQVAAVLEALAHLSTPAPVRSLRQSRTATALKKARSCYDHLAGQAGVALFNAFADKGWVTADGATLTGPGEQKLSDLGIDVQSVGHSRRALVKPCLDWTERRHHLAGAVGAALLSYILDKEWAVRVPSTPRALRITESGHAGFATVFGASLSLD